MFCMELYSVSRALCTTGKRRDCWTPVPLLHSTLCSRMFIFSGGSQEPAWHA